MLTDHAAPTDLALALDRSAIDAFDLDDPALDDFDVRLVDGVPTAIFADGSFSPGYIPRPRR